MFAVMYETGEGKVIKTCEELDEAQELANNTACMGYAVTVFDYDVPTSDSCAEGILRAQRIQGVHVHHFGK